MVRFTIKRGKISKTFVAVAPPYPKVGDAINFSGAEWFVTKAKETEGVLSVKFPKVRAAEPRR